MLLDDCACKFSWDTMEAAILHPMSCAVKFCKNSKHFRPEGVAFTDFLKMKGSTLHEKLQIYQEIGSGHKINLRVQYILMRIVAMLLLGLNDL